MLTEKEQIEIINNLIKDYSKLEIKEDGFLSRGFVIDDGKIVFKFPRNDTVKYDVEIENLDFINSLDLGVNLQKVAFKSYDNKYLAIYGVFGKSLEEFNFDKYDKKSIGYQLGDFLKKLHSVQVKKGITCTLNEEILAWQNRLNLVLDYLKVNLNSNEFEILNKLMFEYMPQKLTELGENLVYSHGDLGDGNIFVDDNGKVGVIDFNESGFFEEAADFMDIEDEDLCGYIMEKYNADISLKQKVEIRRDIRPLIVLKSYLSRNDSVIISKLLLKIKTTLKKYLFLLK